MKHEKGQRVYVRSRGRDSVQACGTVLRVDDDGQLVVRFDAGGGSGPDGMGYPAAWLASLSDVPADAPAVGAPAKCGALHRTGVVCAREAGHNYDHDSAPGTTDGFAWLPEKAKSQMTDTARAQVDNRTGAELQAENARIAETLAKQNKQIGSLEAALKEATGSKLRVGDLHGTVAALRGDVARLEGDVSYWQREAIRLGGRARGAR